jgi:hypothetical protein
VTGWSGLRASGGIAHCARLRCTSPPTMHEEVATRSVQHTARKMHEEVTTRNIQYATCNATCNTIYTTQRNIQMQRNTMQEEVRFESQLHSEPPTIAELSSVRSELQERSLRLEEDRVSLP